MKNDNLKFISLHIVCFFVLTLITSNKILADYTGSNQSGNTGFWHTSKISRIQLGWDKGYMFF